MQRCIDLAKNGLGTTYPNPLVGSVIVYKDRIKMGRTACGSQCREFGCRQIVIERFDDLCEFGTMQPFWKNAAVCRYDCAAWDSESGHWNSRPE